ncbi:serpentine type 7TM GPCR chemoreceptor srd domain-containing protein [Ditylenchus destructor]|nr:serpentine type 7TM GPCR chemoreceptor srd domain-containing protein [Ditylenchus destructor]
MSAPNMLYPSSCIIVNGPYNYFGPQFCIILFVFTFWCIANGKTAQDYCMMYRLTVVLPNQRVHELFMKWQTAVLIQIIFWAVSLEISLMVFFIFRNFQDSKEYLDGWYDEVYASDPLMW